jgi:hypothetical protein
MSAVEPSIVTDALGLVAGAAEQGLEVRLIGGIAVYSRASPRTRAALGRSYGDIDLVSLAKGSRALRSYLEDAGFQPQTVFNATHGDRRLLYHSADDSYHIDVFLDEFSMSHSFDLRGRIPVEATTLPAADLLMTKLQVAEVNAKDLSDAVMLLLDHEPADQDGSGTVNVGHIAGLTSADWGLYTTLTDNFALLERALPTLELAAAERELVRERATRIVSTLADAPKTSRWRMRARVGRRVRWYETPEEIGE